MITRLVADGIIFSHAPMFTDQLEYSVPADAQK